MKAHFHVLDGFRGIAAIAVVVAHGWVLLGYKVAVHGYLAVDLFFLLSGFVIAQAYEQRLRNGMALADFCRRRWLRLYPMIALGAVLGAGVTLATRPVTPIDFVGTFIAQLLVLPTPFSHVPGFGPWPLNPPSWSLFWELLANAAFAVWLVHWRNRQLALLCLVAGAGLACVALIHRDIEVGFTLTSFYGGPLRTFFSFPLGILLSRLHRPSAARQSSGKIGLCLAGALVLILFGPTRSWAYDMVTVMVVFPLILLVAIRTDASHPCWTWLGNMSYPLYLLHNPLLKIIVAWRPHPVGGLADLALLGAYLGLALAAATLVGRFYDTPIRRILERRRATPGLPILGAQPAGGF
ncbi:acyltransferase family protein [Novosphingobium pokkalii]|uniref:Acyltransferase family protein n=1 Tax=Novosphingobium pokkalii TaxID=1770194 RepID=A0ABV7V8L8_9SPHN|nr:acyltransferase [Novosphingobium pokkalii]GHC98810.1 acyltransferase [Novosphingobium pokkalii]